MTNISFLVPEFRNKLTALLTACSDRGVQMEVYTSLVTPIEQARLWRQGRSAGEIGLKILALEHAKATYLASCLKTTEAQETNLVTDALPGHTWFEWGEAVNLVWVNNGRRLQWSAQWADYSTNLNGYSILAEEALLHGLWHGSVFNPDLWYGSSFSQSNLTHGSTFVHPTHGNHANSFWTYLQLRPERNPEQVYTLLEIDAEMSKRYGR